MIHRMFSTATDGFSFCVPNIFDSLEVKVLKTALNAICVLAMFAGTAKLASAQWPAYPTSRAPKTAAGQPDLNAPAPRTPDGKPDLSGVWQNPRPPGAFQNASGTGGAPPPPGITPPANNGPNLFRDIGTGAQGGLPIRSWAAELVKKRQADGSKDNPDAHCLPMGIMQFHNHPQPRKIVQTPELVIIMYEANYGLRQIFMDGRSLPGPDVEPWWYGYSVGRWDGDTLVVETSHLIDEGWLDIIGNPLTDAAKVTERFRRPNFGSLEIEITVDDPKAYTKPWTVTVKQRILLNEEMIEFICIDKDAAHYVGAQK
jgi:hypothetical protein